MVKWQLLALIEGEIVASIAQANVPRKDWIEVKKNDNPKQTGYAPLDWLVNVE